MPASWSAREKFVTARQRSVSTSGSALSAATGEELEALRPHIQGSKAAAFSPDERRLYVLGHDDAVIQRDLATGEKTGEFKDSPWFTARFLVADPKGKSLYVVYDHGAVRWRVDGGFDYNRYMYSFPMDHGRDVIGAVVDPAGTYLYLADAQGRARVGRWSLQARDPSVYHPTHKEYPWELDSTVASLALSWDGKKYLLAGSEDGTILQWNARTGQLMGRFESGSRSSIVAIVPLPDERRFLALSRDGTIRVFSLKL